MKAIETHYKGYRFRSRLEARWAVFFDALGVKWEYEKEGYELPSGWYLPDFWLPDDQLWIEIKGECPAANELRLAKDLAESTRQSVFVFNGLPLEHHGNGFVFELWDIDEWHIHQWKDVVILMSYEPGRAPHGVTFISRTFIEEWGHFGGAILVLNENSKEIKKAADKAKSARFEHGESPTSRQRRR